MNIDRLLSRLEQRAKLMNPARKTDCFSWLEEREGQRALEWVRIQNAQTLGTLTRDPRYPRYYDIALDIARNSSTIPNANPIGGALHDGWIYDLCQDEAHPHGLWRRARLESWRCASPDWQAVLDLDDFNRAEQRNWQLQGLHRLQSRSRRCMLMFSDGGTHSFGYREFDLEDRVFVPEGFELPGAFAAAVAWKDDDTLLVATNFGAGSVSADGFPLTVRSWPRGEPVSAAREIFRADPEDFKAWPRSYFDETGRGLLLVQQTHKRQTDTWWRVDPAERLHRLPLPASSVVMGLYRGAVIARVDENCTVGDRRIQAKSFVSVPVKELDLASPAVRIVKPGSGSADAWPSAHATADGLLIANYENGQTWLDRCTCRGEQWDCEPVPLPGCGATVLVMSDPSAHVAFATYESYLQPKTLYEIHVCDNRVTPVKSIPAAFDASTYMIEELSAPSQDGTSVPYVILRPRALEYQGRTPTLLQVYGAHGLSEVPKYKGALGRLWLDQGGIYVLARVRGGGELGPAWHVVKADRRHTYEDFVAVAEDLIRRKITSSRYLAFHGVSSGGLLVGVTITQRPELAHAAVMELPVLDLLRYDLLGSNSVAVAEFGSVEIPEERAFLERTSPYQHLMKRDDWPAPFVAGSTNDEEVHPGQPRRFAAKMEALGLAFFYHENTSGGGHSMWSTPTQQARWNALFYTYLVSRLMDAPASPAGGT